MRTSIATVCLSGTLEDKLDACAAAGFDGVEIFENDLIASASRPEDIAARCADLGLSLDLYQPFRDADLVSPELFADTLRRAELKFALMERLGADLLLVCSNVATATIDDDALAAEQLSALGDAAAEHGIRLAYEALAWGRYVNDYRRAHRIVTLAGHPAVGTCLDSFHILSRGHDPAEIAGFDPETIFFLQLADAPVLGMDVLSWSRHHRVFPGEGDLPVAALFDAVVASGYAGPVSLEIFNDVFRQSETRRTAVAGLRSLIALADTTARDRAEAARTPGADVKPDRVGLTALPAVTPPTALGFAEVKTTGNAHLERVLGQLGFAYVGTHQSKPVTLWQQGEARIVINAQDADAADPFISALGVDVHRPIDAADRAHRLLAAPVPRTQRVDEEALQAVRAPDGTEIFFCQSGPEPAWATEFHHDGRPAADRPGLGIRRIDHVNLVQPWQHIDEARLFYPSALGLTRWPTLDVAGPAGLVQSQVMSSDDASVRVVLNVNPRAGADAASVSRPEHLALACDDIVAAARAARDAGLVLLPIPQNYYDDLQARFGLDDATVADLRDLTLFYDRDEHGEFLHFYTETIGELYLEVLERRGDYRGFGAPDAPVRMAAQFALSRRPAPAT
ncbi:sugar phosphate isomerase/epimerase and 4-hydroxyphenylpyruvate domain-containing protein [Tersicoccus sp. Bi-70]|uniref:sugar phosphate isomerase/epimerase and 4-hydroxyphenylpyruvate domain-containing protein n=1 Tax=Tersicoccus sp. Bi-70 TaxID=1897634 RepID=UPI0009782AFB|nr:sugar phosphate isomerase/epimerase and 4-hydroxyphenylpyruvate domain-containing protein [Tersicoccus sp. Bi-70]OMH34926.1 4-hydroxyphenylpyruvate dioxygenase [Tersicoccus sp. Bi-70]